MAERAHGGDLQQEPIVGSTASSQFEVLTGTRDVTEIFKTPGKLRGKTPRTARKRNPLEVREVRQDEANALYIE